MNFILKYKILLFVILIFSEQLFAITYYSRNSGGNWKTASTWSTIACNGAAASSYPSSTDDVIICVGDIVTMNAAPSGSCNSLTVYGTLVLAKDLAIGAGGINMFGGNISGAKQLTTSGNLTFSSGTNNIGDVTLIVSGSTTVNNSVIFNINSAGIYSFTDLIISGTFNNSANQPITINGNLQNDGTYTVGTGLVTFSGASNNTITGTSTTAFTLMTVDKGASYANILDVQSIITINTGGLTLTNGTLKLSNSSINVTPFSADITISPFLIPSTAGLWCNGATINSGNFNWTVAGLLQLSSGTVNLGNTSDNSFRAVGGSTSLIIEGGTFNVAGRISRVSTSDDISFTMTGGTINVPTVGSTDATLAPIMMDQAGSTFTMSAGTIILQRAGASNLSFTATAGAVSITGGTLQIGYASTPASQIIGINSTFAIANLSVNSSNATAKLTSALEVLQSITINSGILDANNFNITLGNSWTNNGTYTPGTGSIILNGTGTQTITKSGGSSFYNLTINKPSGSVVLANNLAVSNTLTMTSGSINCGSYTLTLGTSTVSTGTLTYTTGSIIGSFTRWINSTGTGIIFPIATSSYSRASTITFSNITGGTLNMKFTASDPGNSGLPLSESSVFIDNQFTEGYWDLTAANGLSSSNYNIELTGDGFTSYAVSASTRIMYRASSGNPWSLNGTHVDAVGNTTYRTGINGLSAQFAFGKPGCSPYSAVSITGSSSVCTNTTGEAYSVTNTSGNTYTWAITGGSVSGGQGTSDITVDWGATGMIGEVLVTEKNSCGDDNSPVTLVVNINPISTSAISGPTSVSSGETGVAYSVTNTSGYSYSWSFPSGGGTIASGQGTSSVTVDWGTTPGTYSVRVDVTRLCGSPDSQTLAGIVNSPIKSSGSGNWSQTSTWIGGVVPNSSSYVEIQSGHIVTMNGNPGACYKLTIDGTADWTLARTTNIGNGGIIINSTGNITGSGAGILTSTGGISLNSNSNISSTSVIIRLQTNSQNIVTTGTPGALNKLDITTSVNNNGILTIANSGALTGSGTLTQGSNSTLNLYGTTFTLTTLVATASGNTVNYGANTNQNVRAGTYNNLTVSTTGTTNTKTLAGDIVVNGNINITGVTLDASTSNYAITTAGNWTNTGTFNPRNATVTFNGTSSQTITNASGEIFNNLNLIGSGAKDLAANVTINFDFTLNSTVNVGDNDINILGNWDNSGTYNATSNNDVTFSNNTTITGTSNTSFKNVAITGTLTNSASGNMEVTGNWTNNGTFNHNNGTVTFNGTTIIDGASTTTFNDIVISGSLTGKPSGNFNVAGNFTNNGTFDHNSGTVTFTGVSALGGTVQTTAFNNVIVDNGASLETNIGNNITTTGTLTVNGTLTLNSDATGTSTLIDNGIAGTGSLISERYLANTQAWYSSVPISNGQGSLFGLDATNKMFYWDEITGAWVTVSNGDNLDVMKGYPFKSTTNKTISFNGNFNTGDKTIGLTRTPTSTRPGWNLVGNPYPSAIDWEDLGWTKTNVYNNTFWIRSNGTFVTYNANTHVGVPDGTTSIIPAHQSFWVLVDAAYSSGTLTVPNSSRVHDNQNILKGLKASTIDVLRINFAKDGNADQAAICFTASATTANDPYDSEKSMGVDVTIPQLYSLSSANKSLAINSYPTVTSNTEITLGYKAWTAGNHTISISDFSGIDNSIYVYLEDIVLGVIQDMRANNNYTFNTAATTNTTRFKLIFNNNPLPVTYLSFTAIKNKSGVELSWTLSSEKNNDYFIVERSADGFNFTELTKINGVGNSNKTTNYNYSDLNPNDGINYYRLKQVDFNNAYEYSKIVSVNFVTNVEDFVKNVYLDERDVYIQLTQKEINNILIEIYDDMGRLVFNDKLINPTENNFLALPKNIVIGVYFLKIYNTDFSYSKAINVIN